MRHFRHESGFGRQWWSVEDRTPAVMEAGVRRAAGFLDAFIDAELARLGLPAEAYALMGFSQGAMTVLFTGLRRPTAPRAILAFSGALVAPESLTAELANRAPVLLVHGEADDVVPVHRSRMPRPRCGRRMCRWRRRMCRGSAMASTTPDCRWARLRCSGRSPAGEAPTNVAEASRHRLKVSIRETFGDRMRES